MLLIFSPGLLIQHCECSGKTWHVHYLGLHRKLLEWAWFTTRRRSLNLIGLTRGQSAVQIAEKWLRIVRSLSSFPSSSGHSSLMEISMIRPSYVYIQVYTRPACWYVANLSWVQRCTSCPQVVYILFYPFLSIHKSERSCLYYLKQCGTRANLLVSHNVLCDGPPITVFPWASRSSIRFDMSRRMARECCRLTLWSCQSHLSSHSGRWWTYLYGGQPGILIPKAP